MLDFSEANHDLGTFLCNELKEMHKLASALGQPPEGEDYHRLYMLLSRARLIEDLVMQQQQKNRQKGTQ